MKFNSVKEYFYKLQSSGYQLMMVPLIVFILYYAKIGIEVVERTLFLDDLNHLWFWSICGSCILCLTTVYLATMRRVRNIALEVSLGERLEKLGDVILLRMKWMAAIALVLPIALYILHDDRLSIMLAIVFAWFFLQWPSPRRIAKMLKLKGDELKMIRSKGEAFRF